ncbi:unnamed protein product [Trichobilharzia regenti]|nr:unnamed protein product [Trichobilharzia regenti]
MLKAGKAAGPDGISVGALKMDPETTVDLMTPLLEKVWKEGKLTYRQQRFDDATAGEGVERGQSTRVLEERILIQTTKEKRLMSLQKLAWNYAPVHPKQNTKPHHPESNKP